MNLRFPGLFSGLHSGLSTTVPSGLPFSAHKGLLRSLLPYLLVFLFAFALFFVAFYARGAAENAVNRMLHQVQSRGISVRGVHMDWPAPNLVIDSVSIPAGAKELNFSSVRVSLMLFSRSVEVTGEVCGGHFLLTLKPESMTELLPANAVLTLEGVYLPLLPVVSPLFSLTGGTLSASGEAKVFAGTKKDSLPVRLDGTLNLALEEGALKHTFPFLKDPELTGVQGHSRLEVSGAKIALRDCELNAGQTGLHVQGRTELKSNFLQSVLKLEGVLQAPLSLVDEKLLPRRTLDQMKARGAVHFTITQTLKNPSLKIQD